MIFRKKSEQTLTFRLFLEKDCFVKLCFFRCLHIEEACLVSSELFWERGRGRANRARHEYEFFLFFSRFIGQVPQVRIISRREKGLACEKKEKKSQNRRQVFF